MDSETGVIKNYFKGNVPYVTNVPAKPECVKQQSSENNSQANNDGLVQPVIGLPHQHHCPQVARENLQAGNQIQELDVNTTTTTVAQKSVSQGQLCGWWMVAM